MTTNKQLLTLRKIKKEFEMYNGRYLYLIKCNEYYKIGIAFDLDQRLSSLQGGNPYELEVVCAFKIKDARESEKLLHELFKDKRQLGEWFKLDYKDVEVIINLEPEKTIIWDKTNGNNKTTQSSK